MAVSLGDLSDFADAFAIDGLEAYDSLDAAYERRDEIHGLIERVTREQVTDAVLEQLLKAISGRGDQ